MIVYIAIQVNSFEGESMEENILGVYDSNSAAWARNDNVKAECGELVGTFYKVIPTQLNDDLSYD